MSKGLLILAHGNNGHASDWNAFVEQLNKGGTLLDELILFRSCVNEGSKTLTGIRHCGENLFEEVDQFIGANFDSQEKAIATSLPLVVIGHSLGGLLLRYMLPKLLAKHPRFVPVTYCSIATPHLGCRKPGGSPTKATYKFLLENTCNVFYKQTGQELLLRDQDRLLRSMCDPEGQYFQALAQFKHPTLVSSPHYDMLVPYSHAAVSPHNPYEHGEEPGDHKVCVRGHDGFSDRHKQHLKAFERSDAEKKPSRHVSSEHLERNCDNYMHASWQKDMMENLRNISWRRLDVQIKSINRWSVHDGFLNKKPRGVFPLPPEDAGIEFLRLLITLIHEDLSLL